MRYLVLLAFFAAGCGGSAPPIFERELAASGGSGAALDTGGTATGGEGSGGAETGGAATGGSPTGGAATGGEEPCPTGAETCPCYGNDTCDAGLTCFSGLCVDAGTGSGGSGGDAGETGGTADEECTWESAVELAWPNHDYEIMADACVVFGSGEGAIPIYVMALGAEDTILFEFQNSCGQSGSAGLHPNSTLEMYGCRSLADLHGDHGEMIILRWRQ